MSEFLLCVSKIIVEVSSIIEVHISTVLCVKRSRAEIHGSKYGIFLVFYGLSFS